ncbi:MAG: universal stress protein [Gemmatimonadetes bacterium]|nr:universal stress protein [Gemmatimonadota bacterium]
MSTALETPQAGVAAVSGDHNLLGPIIVATDGTSSASAALTAAAQLGDRSGANVIVLAVLEPLPLVAADYGLLLPRPRPMTRVAPPSRSACASRSTKPPARTPSGRCRCVMAIPLRSSRAPRASRGPA